MDVCDNFVTGHAHKIIKNNEEVNDVLMILWNFMLIWHVIFT